MKLIFVLSFLLAAQGEALEVDSSFGKITTQCGLPNASKHVWIFKQWHLSPNDDSTLKKDFPQQKNQTAIYDQLEQWVKEDSLHILVSEGCEGVIDRNFKQKFNGWTYESLKNSAERKDYDHIVSLIPLKLKAKFGDKIAVSCGDDEKLIKEQNAAFSDARGTIGFLTRLKQFKDQPEKAKSYLDMVISLDHLSPRATVSQALKALLNDLSNSVKTIKVDFDKRNKSFVNSLETLKYSNSALVVGGIHAEGLVKLLKAKGIDCAVVEPVGYSADDEKILKDLESLSKE